MKMIEAVKPVVDDQFESQLPVPVGYRVLIALPQVPETFDNSLVLKANTTKQAEHVLSTIGLVIDMGGQAYTDTERFPDGPWCKVGDYVMFRANTGTRFKIEGVEYRLMNDDSIEAVVADPRGITRA
jgi:co-chaperonin GroES (HSP10)